MKKISNICLVGVALVLLISSAQSEIHRARSVNTFNHKFRSQEDRIQKLKNQMQQKTQQSSWNSWLNEKVWGHTRKVWFFSSISSGLVGLTGIVPLLLIPLNCGATISNAISSNRLKYLLSFAVGGLLGDVFLHLLPEAWIHVNDYDDKMTGFRRMGGLFLAGLLSFYIIERLFGGEDEEEEDDEEEKEEREKTQAGEMKEEESDEDQKYKSLEKRVSNDKQFSFAKSIKNERKDQPSIYGNNYLHQRKSKQDFSSSSENVVLKQEVVKEQTHIRVSGWLNLLANVVDNFTHGLAVAGSYCISIKMGLLTTLAILLHEVPHEIGDFAILLQAGFDRWKAAKAQVLTASGGIIGAMIALSAESVKIAGDSTAWILPFTAGGFVNIALVTIVPGLLKEKKTSSSLKQLFIVVVGILVMGLITLLVD